MYVTRFRIPKPDSVSHIIHGLKTFSYKLRHISCKNKLLRTCWCYAGCDKNDRLISYHKISTTDYILWFKTRQICNVTNLGITHMSEASYRRHCVVTRSNIHYNTIKYITKTCTCMRAYTSGSTFRVFHCIASLFISRREILAIYFSPIHYNM